MKTQSIRSKGLAAALGFAAFAAGTSVRAETSADALWTVTAGQALIECTADTAHNIPRMESGGHGVWDFRLVPVSDALGWEECTWAYSESLATADSQMPGLNVNYGWTSYNGGSYTAKYAMLKVNAGTDTWTEPLGDNMNTYEITVEPGQLRLTLERALWHVISFTPFETGDYAVGGFIQHIAGNKGQWGWPVGGIVELRCGGRTLFSDSGRGKVFDFAQSSVSCRAGEAIELWIRADADWSNYYSEFTGAFEISQLAKAESASVWRVNDALKALKASDTPSAMAMSFADGTGISLGASKDGLFDSFAAMNTWDGTTWCMYVDYKFPYPWIAAGDADDDTFELFPGKHNDSTYVNYWSHIKIGWTAPADGLYRTSGFMAHTGNHSGQYGKSPTHEGAVMLAADGQIRRYGTFHNTTSAADGTGIGVNAKRLWLRKGEKVWFATGPVEASRATNYMGEMTARLTVARDDLETLPWVLAFDFGAEGATGYAGRGIDGFSDTTYWNRCAVAEGATEAKVDRVRKMDGKLVGVRLALSSAEADGTLAAGTAEDTACALYGDGVVSASSSDVVNWTLSGLVPGVTYTLTFYGRSPCVFRVGDAARMTPKSGNAWMTIAGGEYCQTTVTATGKTLSGQFYSSSSAGEQALWTGLQVSGESFKEYSGFAIIIR